MGNGKLEMGSVEEKTTNHQISNPSISNLPYRIGLTGNIATGKSTVGRMLIKLGAEVIDADRIVHTVLAPDGAAYPAVVATFGTGILAPDGTIDRRKLGDLVFANENALARLEQLTHPSVIAIIDERIAASATSVVVVEAIKLLESGLADDYEAIWVTMCPEVAQLKRLMRLRHLTREEALRRIHAQPPQTEKVARADVVINTNGTLNETRAQVKTAWENICSGTLAKVCEPGSPKPSQG